jgi:Kef-type K+ transport system membrane component KefB
MDPVLQFLLLLAILIAAAKGAGYLSARLGQPAILGELLVGLILGPTALDILHWPLFDGGHLDELVHYLAQMGVLLLMFSAGLEVDLEAMLRAGRPAALAGVLGVVAPIVLGLAASLPFGFGWQQGLAIGLMLAATSVSISAQTLMELGVLRSRVGMALLGAAVVDDVLVIVFLSLFVALFVGGAGGVLAAVWVLGKMGLFLCLAVVLGFRVIPRLALAVDRLPISEGVMSLTLVVILLFSWGAEFLGNIATITGAFLAGLALARTSLRRRIESGVHTLAYSWLVPIFFLSIGLEANARELGGGGWPFALVLLVVAVISKVLGSGLGARLGGLSSGEALRLGTGMVSRGEVGLIVASVALAAEVISSDVFASVVIMVLATTLVTPLLLRLLYPKGARQPERERQRAERRPDAGGDAGAS